MSQNSKIKILIIQSRICIGGPAVITSTLMRHLDRNRFEPILIGGALEKDEYSRIEELQREGFNVHVIEEMGREIALWQDLKAVIKLYRLMQQERPLIVDTHTAKAGAVGRIAAYFARVPIRIHTFHGHVFHSYFGKLKTSFFIILERILSRLSTNIIVISPSQRVDIVKKYKIAPSEKVNMIRLGFDLERFLYLEKNYQIKKELGLTQNDILIGFIGRLVPIKNPEMMLAVMVELLKHNQKIHLCIAGNGELRSALLHSIKANGIEKHVHFLDWRQDIETIYAGIDLLALTSLNEGSPLTIIEAMASQVPVVATCVGGVPDLIKNRETGLLCQLNNVEEMTLQITELLTDTALKEKVIKNAYQYVKHTYHYSRFIRDIESLYTTLLNRVGIHEC